MDVLEDEGPASAPVDIDGVAVDQLRAFVARIERLEEEKANIANDIKEVYAEAKSSGFDVKVLRKLISMRKKNKHDLAEEEELLAIYRAAVGL
ncbi:DUF2312 domain-containing protein [Pararhodospirillum oryzae]|uniref:UPF0335 protein n=1 Tax=Pararhodospirillum oryzae TaxID=478448 RepID=A0A512H3I2_9PROT|nr:DUF2312 domain-containing protein [Pararhodospirillum oryzae]GEO79960.1 UPF0335 protein [Pararhodospirillum oryzae]